LIHKEDQDTDEEVMPSTLQYLFVESRGRPVVVGKFLVSQACRIPIRRGLVKFHFVSSPDSAQGLCVKAKGGTITMSDGSSTESLHNWHEPGLADRVEHRVSCPKNELLVWNIYRVRHPTGETTEDYWTGDAGMVLLEERAGYRRYGCSDWRSPFDPSALVFEVEWFDEIGDGSSRNSEEKKVAGPFFGDR
jgi:hypothetical protein